MKTKIKRHSHAVLSVVLAVCMVLSCMTVGIIATDAAKVTDQGTVGASTDTQPATDEGAALDNDETADLSESGEGALGANLDEDSPLGAANVYAVAGSWSKTGNNWNLNYFNASTKQVTANLTAGQTYEFKIVSTYDSSNHIWYGANKNYTASDSEYYFNKSNNTNATIKASVTGTYTFTLKREDQNDGAVAIAVTYPATAKTYTISKASTSNGSFTVSKTTATAGTRIDITAKPNRGYQVNSVSVTGGAAVSGSGDNRYFTMPSQNVTVSVTFKTATAYNITAQVTQGSGSITLTLTSGGTTVGAVTTSGTAVSTITAYYGETLKVTASAASGYKLNSLTRGGTPISSGNDSTVTAATGVLAIFSKKSDLPANQYTAKLGSSTASNDNLYTKISASFYDYYTNDEVNGSWYSSIDDKAAMISKPYNRNPYGYFNQALSVYAKKNTLTRPMYFGAFTFANHYWKGGNDEAYHDYGYYRDSRWYNGHLINDSNWLGGNTKALPGLSGKTLADGTIHYYASGTNENGAVMAMFDKDWLTTRSTSDGSTTEGTYRVYFDPGVWATYSGATFKAGQQDGDNSSWNWKDLSRDTNGAYYYDFSNDGGNKMCFQLMENNTLKKEIWITRDTKDALESAVNDKMVRITGDGDDQVDYDIIDYHGNDTKYSTDKALATIIDSNFPVRKETRGTGNNTYTYYTFDSTNGNDNIYFTKSDATTFTKDDDGKLELNYGNSSKAVKAGYNSTKGFFPFDNSEYNHGKAKDLGFGMKLNIKFTLGEGGKINGNDQVFDFSGDDDLWVYIDNQLVLDLGGDHSKTTGQINFASGNVTLDPGANTTLSSTRNGNISSIINKTDTETVHTMTLYYLERGMHESNLKFGFSFHPQDDAYDVEKKLNTASLNEGLKSQFTDTFTFTNTSEDGKGANAAYTLYNSSTNTYVETGNTNESKAFQMVDGGKYAQFKKVFTKQKTLQTKETLSNDYKYDTSYTVVDVQNNNSVIKAGTGLDTGTFNFFTNLENADPDLNITHLRTIFTNTLKTESFMITKAINDFDDSDTEFPFVVNIKMTLNNHEFNAAGLKYKSSLDNYTTERTLGASSISNGGLGYIKEGEYILIEGIPVGAKVTVREPVYGDKKTPEANGNANCYKFVSIASSNENNNPQNTGADVTIQLEGSDIITITNELKNYRMDYQLPTRLYGDKIYKLTGFITPAMVEQGYVEINDTAHTAFLTTKFVSEHIPYETIFMKNVVWKSKTANHNLSKNGIDDYVILTATTGDQKLTVNVDTDGNGFFETTVENLDCGSSILLDGKYITGTKPGATPSYWNIYSTDTGEFVTRCYSTDLMYVAYDNYQITAVYEKGKNTELYDDATSATVNNLGITRSHWNDTLLGTNDPSTYTNPYSGKTEDYKYYKANTDYDRLYLDIELAYESNGKMINTFDKTEVGVGYDICILNNDNTYKKVYKTIDLENTDLNNKNRVHVYYGFNNSENNRGFKLGIRAFVTNNGTRVAESNIMPFELNTVGSKGLSAEYDDDRVDPPTPEQGG